MDRIFFAAAYWLWSAFIAAVGFLTGLDCEYGCFNARDFPPRFQPWTWGDNYYVYPEAFYIGLVGLVFASGFVYFVVRRLRWCAIVAFVLSLVFLSYPFFGGLEWEGRMTFLFGPLLGVVALVVHRREIAKPA